MGIGTILIGVAIFLIAAALVAGPLLEPRHPAIEATSQRESLERERLVLVRTIRELDLDFRTGKLKADDYNALREAQVRRGAAVLRELDDLDSPAAIAKS